MRKLRMWYGLIAIFTVRWIKKIFRKTGGLMKVYGRKLEHIGDDSTPRWSIELFHKCFLAYAEIHLPNKVFKGVIDSIYQEYSGKNSELVIIFKTATVTENFSSLIEEMTYHKVSVKGYGPPIVIKEDGCDCVWTGHKNGYLVIFFK
ncbi:MAG: hypothetical protein Q7K40_02495 [bacterium]|nr:hypothetical protein [bacterium]